MTWHAKYQHSVDIVLAVYNGEKYLQAQLNSLRANQHYDFLIGRVIVCDDNSTDNSLNILKQEARIDSKLEIVRSSKAFSLGAMNNFAKAASLSRNEFVMFCDQDDIWLPTKISDTLFAMVKKEQSIPRLVFSDVNIVDAQLNLLCSSYFTLKKINKDWHENLDNLLKQNVVSGCSMMANRALLHKALPIPQEAYMHDWWLALIAKIEGELIFINKPLLLYRQHENNTIGAGVTNKFAVVKRLRNFIFSVDKCILQAKKLISIYPALKKNNSQVLAWTTLPEQNLSRNLMLFMQGHYKRSSWIGSCAILVYLLFFARGYSKRAAVNMIL